MIARRLLVRLVLAQLATHAFGFSLSAVFGARVLLLEEPAASASRSEIALMGGLSALLAGLATAVVLHRVRRLLAGLDGGDGDAAEVRALSEAPATLAVANVLAAIAVSLGALVPALRPAALSGYTQLALVLLVLTLVSTGALGAYVVLRAQVAKALEGVSPVLAAAAMQRLGPRVFGRLRRRYVLAVAAPVALVALGASLLADAHGRALEQEARAKDAVDMAHAALEPLGEGDEAPGRSEAIAAAAALGWQITLDPAAVASNGARPTADGASEVVVPLGPGAARVRFGAPRLSPTVPVYALLLAAAVVLTAILGGRVAALFDRDVALATREIRRTGVAEVVRGTMILHEGRFSNVQALLDSIDALGDVFREFAGAQRRAIEAREATERMRGLLLASMSHDLKAPLNAVLGFTELVRRNPLSKEQHESLAIIEQRGRELLVLIDTILDSARVEAGELEVSPERTLVADVVMSSVLEARDLSVGSEVQIVGEIQPGIPAVMIDGTRIVQALTAVVMTAARFSDKGIVPVRATQVASDDSGQADRLRIEVETSGEGLPLNEREKIFDAFKSAESARRQGGLGLGLQLARSIVEIHGGSIEVDSTGGGGMIFRVGLPLANDRNSIRARASRPTLSE